MNSDNSLSLCLNSQIYESKDVRIIPQSLTMDYNFNPGSTSSLGLLSPLATATDPLFPQNRFVQANFDSSVPSSRRTSAADSGNYGTPASFRSRQGSLVTSFNQVMSAEVWASNEGNMPLEQFEASGFNPANNGGMQQRPLTLKSDLPTPPVTSYVNLFSHGSAPSVSTTPLGTPPGSADHSPNLPVSDQPVNASPQKLSLSLDVVNQHLNSASSFVPSPAQTPTFQNIRKIQINTALPLPQMNLMDPTQQYQQNPSTYVLSQNGAQMNAVAQQQYSQGERYTISPQNYAGQMSQQYFPSQNNQFVPNHVQNQQPLMQNISFSGSMNNFNTIVYEAQPISNQQVNPGLSIVSNVQNPNSFHGGLQQLDLTANAPQYSSQLQMPAQSIVMSQPPAVISRPANQCTCGKIFKKATAFRSHCRKAHGFDPSPAATYAVSTSQYSYQPGNPQQVMTPQYSLSAGHSYHSPANQNPGCVQIVNSYQQNTPQYYAASPSTSYISNQSQPVNQQNLQHYSYSTNPYGSVGHAPVSTSASVHPSMVYNGMVKSVMHRTKTIERERAFACERCEKTFLRRHDLKRHMLTHLENGTKPFECSQCGVTFTRQDAMQRHIKAERCKNAKRGSSTVANDSA